MFKYITFTQESIDNIIKIKNQFNLTENQIIQEALELYKRILFQQKIDYKLLHQKSFNLRTVVLSHSPKQFKQFHKISSNLEINMKSLLAVELVDIREVESIELYVNKTFIGFFKVLVINEDTSEEEFKELIKEYALIKRKDNIMLYIDLGFKDGTTDLKSKKGTVCYGDKLMTIKSTIGIVVRYILMEKVEQYDIKDYSIYENEIEDNNLIINQNIIENYDIHFKLKEESDV